MEEGDKSINESLSSHPNSLSCSSSSSGEVSSWCTYLDNFLAAEAREREDYFADIAANSTASGAAASRRSPTRVGAMVYFKDLVFKNWKTKGAIDDDSLADTATSSVNNPTEKAGGHGNGIEMKREDVDRLKKSDKATECSELRKRGLCLVPLSKLPNSLSSSLS